MIKITTDTTRRVDADRVVAFRKTPQSTGGHEEKTYRFATQPEKVVRVHIPPSNEHLKLFLWDGTSGKVSDPEEIRKFEAYWEKVLRWRRPINRTIAYSSDNILQMSEEIGYDLLYKLRLAGFNFYNERWVLTDTIQAQFDHFSKELKEEIDFFLTELGFEFSFIENFISPYQQLHVYEAGVIEPDPMLYAWIYYPKRPAL